MNTEKHKREETTQSINRVSILGQFSEAILTAGEMKKRFENVVIKIPENIPRYLVSLFESEGFREEEIIISDLLFLSDYYILIYSVINIVLSLDNHIDYSLDTLINSVKEQTLKYLPPLHETSVRIVSQTGGGDLDDINFKLREIARYMRDFNNLTKQVILDAHSDFLITESRTRITSLKDNSEGE